MDFDSSVRNGVIIKAGEPLRLPAVVTGRPQPEVKWAKDDAEIDTERMVVEAEGKNSALFIRKAVRADHGKYKITGTNGSGTKTAETRVDVLGQCEMNIQLNIRLSEGFTPSDRYPLFETHGGDYSFY